MKKISVVIPCYNAAKYLDRCMEHLLKQTIGLENIEIILVDDASTDDGATLSLMMEYEKKYPDNIIVIPLEQNLRQGGARNVGVLYADGEYLMFCDADDWLMLDAMEILYHIASKNDADVVEFQFEKVGAAEADKAEETALDKFSGEENIAENIEDKIKCSIWEFGENDEKRKEFMILCTDNCRLGCWNKLYRMQMIKDNHIRFAEHLICEEPAFTLPVRIYERKHVLINAKLYCYFYSSGSTIRSNWDDKKFDNINVWMILIQDMEERGLLEKYYSELEYMMYGWGFKTGMRMLSARGYALSVDELNAYKQAVLERFPHVLKNAYVVKETDGWSMLMQALLEMELTEENVPKLNNIMQDYLQKWLELMNK